MSPGSSLVPADFEVPLELVTDRCLIRPLVIHDVVRDYEAVMTSVEHLQRSFGVDYGWPTEHLSLVENLIDLGWHQKEFERRSSFAFAVFDLENRRELGCLYINPSPHQSFDAMVYMWVRADEVSGGLDEHVESIVRHWISTVWPFERVAYPGRDIPWDEWRAMGPV